jgi:predicted PurR-regulated permease PerM
MFVLMSTFADFLWSLLIIFFMIVYFMMLFHVVVDIFRRKDASGGTKALWLLFLLILPLFGLLIYLIVHGQDMTERDVQGAQRSQAQFDDYVRTVGGGGGGAAAEIERAKGLLDSGAISQAEFDQIKTKALAS